MSTFPLPNKTPGWKYYQLFVHVPAKIHGICQAWRIYKNVKICLNILNEIYRACIICPICIMITRCISKLGFIAFFIRTSIKEFKNKKNNNMNYYFSDYAAILIFFFSFFIGKIWTKWALLYQICILLTLVPLVKLYQLRSKNWQNGHQP